MPGTDQSVLNILNHLILTTILYDGYSDFPFIDEESEEQRSHNISFCKCRAEIGPQVPCG